MQTSNSDAFSQCLCGTEAFKAGEGRHIKEHFVLPDGAVVRQINVSPQPQSFNRPTARFTAMQAEYSDPARIVF
jgi:hypothetical protein